MYTNNEANIVNEVKEHLKKGDTKFQLYFAERTMDEVIINDILGGFFGVSLPDNLNLELNFNTSNVEDYLVKHLADKLSEISWPSKFNLTLSLRNNSLDDDAANILLDLLKKFDKFPEAEIMIDLDNNNCLSSSIVGDALEKIKNSAINDNAIANKDKNKTIKFCNYLIEEYLSKGNEEDEEDF